MDAVRPTRPPHTSSKPSGAPRRVRSTALAVSALALGFAVGPAALAANRPATPAPNDFTQTNLVANNASSGAQLVDPNLTNAWGLAASSTGPIWVSDNNSGDASVYSGGVKGSSVSLDLTVPVPGGNPTGQVFNTTSDFPVGGSTGPAAIFIVDSDSIGSKQSPGEIAAWDGGSAFVVEDSPTGGPGGDTPANAVFKGLALSSLPKAGPELFAAYVANAQVDVFNMDFVPLSTPTEFRDPAIPAGYAPFNVQQLGSDIYVTYGKQNKAKTNVVAGAGRGYVDVYTPNGVLIKHLISGGSKSQLNEPWGLAVAPNGFGPFAGKLLVGNLGNGWINVFNRTTGAYLGALEDGSGYPIAIDGLWGLRVGTSAFGGTNALIFSAGPAGYRDGLLGTLTPAK